MTTEKKLAMLEETLDIEAGTLRPEMHLDGVEGWDSMGKLSLIVLMDDEFGKRLSSEEIKGFETVRDILDFME